MQEDEVVYQVCVDQPGDYAFDGTGLQYKDQAEAIEHLAETRLTRPYAYLARVTYQRCSDDVLDPPACDDMENADWITSFTDHGLSATKTLQALSNLLGTIKPGAEEDYEDTIRDLTQAIAGMETHLRIIYDCFDNIQVRTMSNDAKVVPFLPGLQSPESPLPSTSAQAEVQPPLVRACDSNRSSREASDEEDVDGSSRSAA